MSILKKCLIACMVTVSYIPSLVYSQPSQYTSQDSNNPIQSLEMGDDSITLILNPQSADYQKLLLYLHHFYEDRVLAKMPTEINSEKIQTMAQNWNIHAETIQSQIDPADYSTIFQYISALEDASQGIYPKLSPEGFIAFYVTQPEVLDEADKLVVKIYDQTLLSFDKDDEGQLHFESYQLQKQ